MAHEKMGGITIKGTSSYPKDDLQVCVFNDGDVALWIYDSDTKRQAKGLFRLSKVRNALKRAEMKDKRRVD